MKLRKTQKRKRKNISSMIQWEGVSSIIIGPPALVRIILRFMLRKILHQLKLLQDKAKFLRTFCKKKILKSSLFHPCFLMEKMEKIKKEK